MRLFRRIFAMVWLNLRNIPRRLASSLVTIVGVAAVVLVFAAVLSIARGFERTLTSAGAEDTAIVMRTGATSEMNSGVSHEQALIVANAPGVLKSGDRPVASFELYVVADVKKRSNQEEANVPLRGVEAAAFEVRQNIELVEGRMFEAGKYELVVGRAAQREFVGLDLGDTIRFGPTEWSVVGVFDANGGIPESELWTDVRVLQNVYRRGNSYQSVRVKLETVDALEAFKAALDADPRIQPDVMTEKAYYASQAENMTTFISLIGYPLAALMAIGAVFGALNSMYASVSARGKEIATLRALGFGPLSVMLSTLVESMLLALAGGLLGAGIAYLAFNGFQASTLSAGFSQVVFNFAVTPDLLVQGITAALFIGLLGGIFPAIRAARLPVAMALREL